MISYNPIITLINPLPLSCSSPFPLPTGLFSVSVSLFLFCFVHLFVVFFRFHKWYLSDIITKWYHHQVIEVISSSIFFSVWLISLSRMPSKSIHVAANGKFSWFLWLSRIPPYIYVPRLLYLHICWWTFRLLPYLAVNSTAMKIGCMYLSELVLLFFSDLYPRVELLGEFKAGTGSAAFPPWGLQWWLWASSWCWDVGMSGGEGLRCTGGETWNASWGFSILNAAEGRD